MSDLDKFLSTAAQERKSSSKCFCCKTPELRATIDQYLDLLESGETQVPIKYLHENHLLPKFGKPRNKDSVYNHVRNCLRRSTTTGKPLDLIDER